MKKLMLVLLSITVVFSASALAVDVPNGDFETLYKPGTMIPGVLNPDAWTYGCGLGVGIESGDATFADTSVGTVIDMPGWVGYDVQGWLDNGGTYGRQDMDPLPGELGNLQGSLGRQGSYEGMMSYLSNGGGWGNPAGGLITSEASLGAADGSPLILEMMATEPGAAPIVLDLLANGVVLTPTGSVVNASDVATWNLHAKWYDDATMAAVAGQDLTIVIGIDRGSTGGQTKFDNVTLVDGIVPEPATMALLALGGLLIRRRR